MSEIPTGDLQLVGQADASKQTSEALPKDEIELNAEQKQVVDVMQREGQNLETAVLDARENAAGKLKQLYGKELVDAGLRQMGHGVWETVKSQMKWGVGGGLVGMLAGGLSGAFTGRPKINDLGIFYSKDILDEFQKSIDKKLNTSGIDAVAKNSIEGAGVGSVFGGEVGNLIGFEAAGLGYNRHIATKNNLPPTKWYDWVIGNAGLMGLRLLTRGRDIGTAGQYGLFVVREVFSPIAVAGMRNVATGLWQMKKG